MLTKESPPKTVNMAQPGGLFGLQQCGDDNSESPDESSRHAIRKDSQFGIYNNQCHPPQGYGYPSSQQPFPGTPQFYHQSPFNMTHSSQPTSSTSQGYASYGPPWQGYDLHQGGFGGSQMFPPSAVPKTRAIISRCTESACRTAGKSSSQSVNSFQLHSSPSTSFQCTWETPHKSPDEMIPATSGTAENRCRRDCGLAPIGGDVLRTI